MSTEQRSEHVRREIEELAGSFAEDAEPALEEALHHGMGRLVEKHATWLNSLDDRSVAALKATVAETIRKSSMEVAARLRDPDIWLEPTVLVDGIPDEELDNSGNRVWVTMLNAARQLDAVLGEFGLPPSEVPDPGGGHYGIQPRSAAELDRSGKLRGLWQRFRRMYEDYRRALREPEEERERRDRDEARRRWNER
ncbi:MAG TPA: hypothetical protein VEA19_01465 [Actinomycetota bacterium]|nr:hypothetical protein [Actinomycetota bacterium]